MCHRELHCCLAQGSLAEGEGWVLLHGHQTQQSFLFWKPPTCVPRLISGDNPEEKKKKTERKKALFSCSRPSQHSSELSTMLSAFPSPPPSENKGRMCHLSSPCAGAGDPPGRSLCVSVPPRASRCTQTSPPGLGCVPGGTQGLLLLPSFSSLLFWD